MNVELKKGVFWNGVYDRDLRVFDIIMETEFGTTYNAYTVKGSEKTAVIESAKQKFEAEYMQNLQEVTSIDKIDYIIVNHTEPDHSGSIEKLLEMNPDIEIIGTTAAIRFVGAILNKPFKSRVVKDGEEISLGDKTLRFIMAPNLHWPDTMFTYIPEDKVLFTCDSFGAHYGTETVLRSGVKDEEGYMRAAKYYFDMILGPFKSYMQKAIEKVKALDLDLICTGHGPVLDSKIDELIATYETWSKRENPNPNKTVVIPYVSAYGYTKAMAESIAKGIKSEGVDVLLVHLVDDDCSGLADALLYADGILLGSPTMLGDALKPIYDLTTSMLPAIHGGKQAAAFGSYGWSGEAVDNLTQRLKQLKMKTSDGIKVQFKPSEEDLQNCEAFGREFAKKVL